MSLLLLLAAYFTLATSAATASRPNIIVIVTDDQRADAVDLMPRVQEELVARGVTFTNAFASNPICCPSRTTILTGRHSHTTGVLSNRTPFGSLVTFRASGFERATVAVALRRAGYRTALVGKYLNAYRGTDVPPGWDEWMAFTYGWGYYDYQLNLNGRRVRFGSRPSDYSTDVLGRLAARFVRRTRQPFFLYFAPAAPHAPTTPAPRHVRSRLALRPFPSPSIGERDLSDKPAYVRRAQRPFGVAHRVYRKRQYLTLLAVDDAVGRILTALRETRKLERTIIVFTSDNGVQWGEHGFSRSRKAVPYEGSIRVPLVVRYDPLTRDGRVDGRLVGNVDLAPTFASLAGIPFAADGRSLAPLLRGTAPRRWRRGLILENMGGESESTRNPTFCGVRTEGHMYALYETGEEELYELASDPHELENRANDRSVAHVRQRMREHVRELCFPLPPGYHPRALCTLSGSAGKDVLTGGTGADYACGYGGRDRLSTGRGDDTVDAGSRTIAEHEFATFAARRTGGRGARIDTGVGDDRVLARNSRLDTVRCGPGRDRVVADLFDVVGRDCERVSRPRR